MSDYDNYLRAETDKHCTERPCDHNESEVIAEEFEYEHEEYVIAEVKEVCEGCGAELRRSFHKYKWEGEVNDHV